MAANRLHCHFNEPSLSPINAQCPLKSISLFIRTNNCSQTPHTHTHSGSQTLPRLSRRLPSGISIILLKFYCISLFAKLLNSHLNALYTLHSLLRPAKTLWFYTLHWTRKFLCVCVCVYIYLVVPFSFDFITITISICALISFLICLLLYFVFNFYFQNYFI